MRNIIEIAKHDFKNMFSNSIVLLVVIGLACVPCMYAWFTIAGMWDPYSNTSNLQVAVANEDEGYISDDFPIKISIGDSISSSLSADTSFKWVFVNEEKAIEGVKAGEYYAAIVIPKDFSKDAMSFFSDSTVTAHIDYYSNEKRNAVVPKLTDKGINSMQQSIRKTFTESLSSSLLRVATNLLEFANSDDLKTFTAELGNSISVLKTDLEAFSKEMYAISDLLGSTRSLLKAAGDAGDSSDATQEAKIRAALEEARTELATAKTRVEQVRQKLVEEGAPASVLAIVDKVDAAITSMQDLNNQTGTVLDSMDSTASSMEKTIASMNTSLDDAQAKLNEIGDDLASIATRLSSLSSKLIDFSSGNATLEELQSVLGSDPSELAKTLSSPVQIERVAVYPVANYGSAMASFFTALSIWIGATLMVALLRAKPSNKTIEEIERKRKTKVRPYQVYLGRYAIFAAISLAQALLLCLGDIFFMGIQCVHPALFILTGCIISIVFSNLIYTLAVSFGSVGKALAVILLVMQISGAGGMFPVEMLDPAFQAIYPYLPFTYAIKAFQECVAGLYGTNWLFCVGVLVVYLVPFALVMGMLLRVPFIRLNEWIEKKLKETKLMG